MLATLLRPCPIPGQVSLGTAGPRTTCATRKRKPAPREFPKPLCNGTTFLWPLSVLPAFGRGPLCRHLRMTCYDVMEWCKKYSSQSKGQLGSQTWTRSKLETSAAKSLFRTRSFTQQLIFSERKCQSGTFTVLRPHDFPRRTPCNGKENCKTKATHLEALSTCLRRPSALLTFFSSVRARHLH